MQNYVQEGKILEVTAPYALASGAGCKVGNVFGVSCGAYLISTAAQIQTKGVFDLTKDASVFSQGDLVYWDNTAKKATSTVGSNLLIGVGTAAALTGGTTVRVALFGVPGFSGQASGLKVAHALYDFAVDGGATCVPANSDTIPDNAVVLAYMINSTSAVTAGGAATVAFGTDTGSSAAAIKAATAISSLTLDAVLGAICTTPFKMTAAGEFQLTIATGPLTAGVIEVWVIYFQASA